MEERAYCNWLIMAFTAGFSIVGFRDRAFRNKYLFQPEAVLAWHQYHRLLTAGFLHADLVHLLVNMMSLYFFGPFIEAMCGPGQFLTFYLGAIVGGNLLSLYVHRYHDYRALGASGGVAGIMFAHILLFPGEKISLMLLPLYIPGWLYAAVFLLASFYGMHRAWEEIGHDAHLGGALAGLFIAAGLHPVAVLYRPLWFGGLVFGTGLLFLYLARNPMLLPSEGMDFTKGASRPGPRFVLPGWSILRRGKKRRESSRFSAHERGVDAILQKISEHGFQALTEDEKSLLNETSTKYRRRAARVQSKWHFPF